MKKYWSTVFAITWAVLAVSIVFVLTATNLFMPEPNEPWIVTHILSPAEPESQALLNELLDRKPAEDTRELVILVDAQTPLTQTLLDRGYVVHFEKTETLQTATLGLKPPYYLLTSPRDEGAFAGPYKKITEAEQTLETLRGRTSFIKLSAAGCGLGVRVRNLIDSKFLVYNVGK
jgi:hypothetical protein